MASHRCMGGYQKSFLDNAYAQRWIGVGERPNAPFRILVPLVGRSKTSVEGVVSTAASMAQMFEYSETVFVVDERWSDETRLSELHPAPMRLRRIGDDEAGTTALGELLRSDVDFVFPADDKNTRRWRAQLGLSRAANGKFAWPPNSWGDRGSSPDKPFRILAPVQMINFGDFIGQLYATAKIAAKFKHTTTTFLIHDERDYQRAILKYYPYEYELFGTNTIVGFNKGIGELYNTAHDFFMPSEHSCDKFTQNMGLGFLTVPDSIRTRGDTLLCQAGLDPDRWFCCLHFRQPNYRFKPVSNCRDADPTPYLDSIDYVIDELDGQVVLLGHPEMVTRPSRAGFVDLSRFDDNADLQMCAVARSRFMYGSGAGACSMAYALGVPNGVGNHADFWQPGNTASITQTLVTPNDERLNGWDLFESGWMNTKRIGEHLRSRQGFSILKPGEADVLRLANHMVQATQGLSGWRAYRSPEREGIGGFNWPFPMALDHTFI